MPLQVYVAVRMHGQIIAQNAHVTQRSAVPARDLPEGEVILYRVVCLSHEWVAVILLACRTCHRFAGWFL